MGGITAAHAAFCKICTSCQRLTALWRSVRRSSSALEAQPHRAQPRESTQVAQRHLLCDAVQRHEIGQREPQLLPRHRRDDLSCLLSSRRPGGLALQRADLQPREGVQRALGLACSRHHGGAQALQPRQARVRCTQRACEPCCA